MHKDLIDEIWQLIYETFEGSHFSGIAPMLATQASVSEVQRRVLANVSAMKVADGALLAELADAVLADVLLAEASGWMTAKTSERLQELLGEL